MTPATADALSPAVEVYFLGTVAFDRALALQQRLVYDLAGRGDGQIALLLCEHPTIITVGRGGATAGLPLGSTLVRTGQVAVRWVNRGGGMLLHTPGQLAVYPVVPLDWHRLSVGQYLQRLQAGIQQALGDLGITGTRPPEGHGLNGRTGRLVELGIAVRNWVAYHGAFINVNPALGLFRLVEGDPCRPQRFGSLAAERGPAVKMTALRTAIVSRLTEILGCDRYHLYSGHPLLKGLPAAAIEA